MIGNSRIAVIGGCGFIGSQVTRNLLAMDNFVLVLDNLINGSVKLLPGREDLIFKWFDIRDDYHDLAKVLRNHKIRYVMNLAAEPYIPECFERPKHFFVINAIGVLNVILACEEAEVKRLLQYSSAEIYGTKTGKINEDEILCPQSTYGVSKQAADALCTVRHRESGFESVILRQFNCYGPRETHEYVVPEIISQLDKSAVLRLGNIRSYRDFLYVDDAAWMAIELMEKGGAGEVYNLGSEAGTTIEDLAYTLGRLMRPEERIQIEIDPKKLRPWDIERLQSDNSKIYRVIDHRPKVAFEQGLRYTIDYFYENGHRWDF